MISLGVVQFEPMSDAREANLERTLAFIRDVGPSVDLLVFPELCLTGYVFRDRSHAAAQSEVVGSEGAIKSWTQAARQVRTYIVAGLIEQSGERLYNSAVVVGPEGVVGLYRKIHLPHTEWDVFDPGDIGFPVIELPFAHVGLLICYDLRFVEASRVLMLKGTDVLCVPTTWTDLHERQPFDQHGWCMANYMAKATAYFNRYFVACADRIGGENRQGGLLRYLGSSLVIGPYGEVLAGPAPLDREVVLTTEVDIGRATDKGLGAGDLVTQRQPHFYRPLVGAVE